MSTRDKERILSFFRTISERLNRRQPVIQRWQRMIVRHRRSGTLKDFALLALTDENSLSLLLGDHGLDIGQGRRKLRTNHLIRTFAGVAGMKQILIFLRACREYKVAEDRWWDQLSWLWGANPAVIKTDEVVCAEDVETIFECLARGETHGGECVDQEISIKSRLIRQLNHGLTGEIPELAMDDERLVRFIGRHGAFVEVAPPDIAQLAIIERYQQLTVPDQADSNQ